MVAHLVPRGPGDKSVHFGSDGPLADVFSGYSVPFILRLYGPPVELVKVWFEVCVNDSYLMMRQFYIGGVPSDGLVLS